MTLILTLILRDKAGHVETSCEHLGSEMLSPGWRGIGELLNPWEQILERQRGKIS